MNLTSSKQVPLVTIITATYNSGETIRDTLEAIVSQDYPNIEHIIVDGRSTDNTLAIVSEYPHVSKIISEKDLGIYDAMNKGIGLATGDIIGVLNSDDFYVASDVVSQVVGRMQAENTSSLYGDLIYVHAKQTNKVLRTWIAGNFQKRKFMFGWMPPHPTFFVSREVYKKHGHFNIKLKSAADYELMLRFLFKENISVSYLPRVLVKMRIGGMSNASFRNRIQANREDREAWRVNLLQPYFFTVWMKPLRKLFQFVQKSNNII